MTIENRAVHDRAFSDPAVRKYLDSSTIQELIEELGQPEVSTHYAKPTYWKPGDGRPSLADEDPAAMSALARCVAHRSRTATIRGPAGGDFAHPEACGWCEYPVRECLIALDWALWYGRYVTTELLLWRQSQSGPGWSVTYVRSSGRTGYQQPQWRDFAAKSPEQQRKAVSRVRT
jgi:hypothetical protein